MTTTDEPRLRIGELADLVGLNPKAIRYYEQVGLLPEPERSSSNYRLFGPADAERLRFVKGVRQLGFSLGEIAEILALRERGEAPCSYVLERLECRGRAIDRQIAELVELKDALSELRRRARRLRPHRPATGGYCHILEQRSGQEGPRIDSAQRGSNPGR